MQKVISVEGKGIIATATICGDPTSREVQLVIHELLSAVAEARLEAQQS